MVMRRHVDFALVIDLQKMWLRTTNGVGCYYPGDTAVHDSTEEGNYARHALDRHSVRERYSDGI